MILGQLLLPTDFTSSILCSTQNFCYQPSEWAVFVPQALFCFLGGRTFVSTQTPSEKISGLSQEQSVNCGWPALELTGSRGLLVTCWWRCQKGEAEAGGQFSMIFGSSKAPCPFLWKQKSKFHPDSIGKPLPWPGTRPNSIPLSSYRNCWPW